MTDIKKTVTISLVAAAIIGSLSFLYRDSIASGVKMIADYRSKSLQADETPFKKSKSTVNTVTPYIPLSDTDTVSKTKPKPQQPESDEPWGVAKKVQEGTYTIKVGYDAGMASPQEVLSALNSYRNAHGSGSLSWSDTLGQYAQSRADYFKSIGNSDTHAGFNNYLENENGFEKLGFNKVGENSYFGGPLEGPHLIEWVFAQSPGHNENQLSKDWSHVGIGVSDTSVNLNFGGN